MAFLKNTKGSLISDYFKVQDDIGDFKSGTVHFEAGAAKINFKFVELLSGSIAC